MKLTHLLVVAALALLVSGVSEARDRKHHTYSSTEETTITTTSSAPEYSGGSTPWGLGYSTAGDLSGTTSATALFELDGTNMLQVFASVAGTSPSFSFSTGGLFKHTLAGNRTTGFHVGGGLALGTIGDGAGGTAFGMAISGVAGFHFELPGLSHVSVHLDGGPTFSLASLKAGTQTNFSIGALSTALGLSVFYMF